MPNATTNDPQDYPWAADPWPPFARPVSPIGPTRPDASWSANDRASIHYARRLRQWMQTAVGSLGPQRADELIDLLSVESPRLSERGPGVAVERGLFMLLARELRLLGQARGAPRRVWQLPIAALHALHPLGDLPPDASDDVLASWTKHYGLDGWIDAPNWWHARMEACRDTSRQPRADELAATLQDKALSWSALERGDTERGRATALEVVTSRGELIVIDAAATGRRVQSLQVTRRGIDLGCDAAARAIADVRGLSVRAAAVEAIGEYEPMRMRLDVAGIDFELAAGAAIVMLRDSPRDVTADPSLAGCDAEAAR